jgi:hypothetical protein
LYEESEIEVPSRSVDLPNSDMIGFYRYWLLINFLQVKEFMIA